MELNVETLETARITLFAHSIYFLCLNSERNWNRRYYNLTRCWKRAIRLEWIPWWWRHSAFRLIPDLFLNVCSRSLGVCKVGQSISWQKPTRSAFCLVVWSFGCWFSVCPLDEFRSLKDGAGDTFWYFHTAITLNLILETWFFSTCLQDSPITLPYLTWVHSQS